MSRGAITGALLAVSMGACTYDFAAASRRGGGSGGEPASSSSAMSSSSSAGGGGAGGEVSACFPGGEPGPFNIAGEVGATPPYTYWYWPQDGEPLTAMEWALSVDFEPPNDGYFWAHQFGFLDADAAGFIGMQQHGTFIAEPPDGPVDITKMVLFSIAEALDADSAVPSPNGTVHAGFDDGPGYSVHIRYDWVPCRTYAFRIAHLEDDPQGDAWYGAWITDTATADETMIGRILVPGSWGPLDYWSVYFSERFGFNALVACDIQEHASAVFTHPTGNGGRVLPSTKANQFQDPPHCANSRFTQLENAVRQEMGVPGAQ